MIYFYQIANSNWDNKNVNEAASKSFKGEGTYATKTYKLILEIYDFFFCDPFYSEKSDAFS